MDTEETTELRLIRHWRSGDRHSGDRLLRRYLPVLQSYFSRRVNSNVDDLIQRTLLACVQAVDRYEGRSSFKTYLLGIAHHQFLMSLRREPRPGGDVTASGIPTGDDSPSQLAAFRQEHFILVKALIRLSPEYLNVLKLFYWSQLSVEQIAETLSIAPGTVKSRLSRGRAELKTIVSDMNLKPSDREEALRELASWVSSRDD
ncbi:MAG: sigma-70 family RNA polymerase sigma factor [Myxococcota bacterium]|nr:sigma-70 family RNA polymerase sigma factor [Myxococcota bacterium]